MSRTGEEKSAFRRDVVERMTTEDRPPQLNGANRGGRSGCGCKCNTKAKDGGRGEDGAAPSTPSNTHDHLPDVDLLDENFLKGSEGVERLPSASQSRVVSPQASRVYGPSDLIHTPFGDISCDGNGFCHLERLMGYEGLPRSMENRVDSPNSMANEANFSRPGSGASSVIMSVRSETPRQFLPFIGSWNDDLSQSDYHFSGAPLRLTAQRRYCHGIMPGLHSDNEDGSPIYPAAIFEEDLH